jgi:hypothetical protein
LVSIETEEEWKFLNSEIQKRNSSDNEWYVGLRKTKGKWKWISSYALTIDKWQPYQPSGDGNTVVIAKSYPIGTQGLFNDIDSNERYTYFK